MGAHWGCMRMCTCMCALYVCVQWGVCMAVCTPARVSVCIYVHTLGCACPPVRSVL